MPDTCDPADGEPNDPRRAAVIATARFEGVLASVVFSRGEINR